MIEHPRRKPQPAAYRAGYIGLSVLAVLFLAFALVHRFSNGWPADQRETIAQVLKPPAVEPASPGPVDLIAPAPRPAPRPQAETPLAPAIATPPPEAPGAVPAPGDRAAPPKASAPIRVFIHYPADGGDALPAIQLAALLQTRGFEVADIRLVGFDIKRPSVRYFFDRDRAPSRRLVDAISASFPDEAPDEATDFSHFSPKPRPGNVEVWLPAASRDQLAPENSSS